MQQKVDPWFKFQTSLAPIAGATPMLREPPVLRTRVVPNLGEGQQELGVLKLYRWAGFAAAPLMTYHGFKRTGSVGWAVAWSAFGAFMPFLAVPIAVAQGFANRKRK